MALNITRRINVQHTCHYELVVLSNRYLCSRSAIPSESNPNSSTLPILDLSFTNTQEAFKSKTTGEVARGLLVLQLCSWPWFVKHNLSIMHISQRLLGKTVSRKLLRMSFFGQFVGGETEAEVAPLCERMKRFGVGSMLNYGSEAGASVKDVDSIKGKDSSNHTTSAQSGFEQQLDDQKQFGINTDHYIKSIHQAETLRTGCIAIKLSSIASAKFLASFSSICGKINQFYHITIQDINQSQLLDKNLTLSLKKLDEIAKSTLGITICPFIDTILDSNRSIEAKKGDECILFKHIHENHLQLANYLASNTLDSQAAQSYFALLKSFQKRIEEIAEVASSKDIVVHVDAEQSYFRDGFSLVAMEMMKKHNRNKTIIFNTYQCYLKDAYRNLQIDMILARNMGINFGAKVVRGAYMAEERRRSQNMNIEDPVHADFEATSSMYGLVVKTVLDEATSRASGKVALMCATHNEESVRLVVHEMHQRGFRADSGVVSFGQLYGMCDHVSFTLGQAKYPVYKYVPYGPVDEIIPYLSRRALENSAIVTKIEKERNLMMKELVRRTFRFA